MPLAIVLPESPEGAENVRQVFSSFKLILSVALTAVSAVIYVVIFVGTLEFRDLFLGFGAKLPVLTQFVLASYNYFGLFLLVGLIPSVRLVWNRNRSVVEKNRLFTMIIVSFALSISLMGVFVVAMYMPIFQLGTVVQ